MTDEKIQEEKLVAAIPDDETLQVQHIIDGKLKYVTTRHKYVNSKFFFYSVKNDKLQKTEHESDNPMDFYPYVI